VETYEVVNGPYLRTGCSVHQSRLGDLEPAGAVANVGCCVGYFLEVGNNRPLVDRLAEVLLVSSGVRQTLWLESITSAEVPENVRGYLLRQIVCNNTYW
jgi:hypothetical protein